MAESWLDFTYHGQRSTVHDNGGELRVFAEDDECPLTILTELMGYLGPLQKS